MLSKTKTSETSSEPILEKLVRNIQTDIHRHLQTVKNDNNLACLEFSSKRQNPNGIVSNGGLEGQKTSCSKEAITVNVKKGQHPNGLFPLRLSNEQRRNVDLMNQIFHIHEGNSEAQTGNFFLEKEQFLGPEFQALYTDHQIPQRNNGSEGFTESSSIHISLRRWKRFNAKNSLVIRERKSSSCSNSENNETMALRKALQSERVTLDALYAELEEERNASAIATNEAMTMIARLQKEKAALQMEARQYKRLAEEKEAHNQEAIAVLKGLFLQKENDVSLLENELHAYRQILQKIEPGRWGKNIPKHMFLEKGINETGLCVFEAKTDSISYYPEHFIQCSNSNNNKVTLHTFQQPDKGSRSSSKHFSDSPRCNLMEKFDNVAWGQEERSWRNRWLTESNLSGDMGEKVARILEKPYEKKGIFAGKEFSKDEPDQSFIWQRPASDARSAKVPITISPRKSPMGNQTGELLFATETGNVSPVWECLKRIEERLVWLGEQQQHNKKVCNGPGGEVFHTSESDSSTSIYQKCSRKHSCEYIQSANGIVASSGCLSPDHRDNVFPKRISEEKLEAFFAQRTSAEGSGKNLCEDYVRQGAKTDFVSEKSCGHGWEDSNEWIHDIYEVQNDLQASGRHLSAKPEGKEDCNLENRLGKPDSFPARPECIQEVQETSAKRSKDSSPPCEAGSFEDPINEILLSVKEESCNDSKCDQPQATFGRRDDFKNMGGEAAWLPLRLQALEAERIHMKQTIESLRKENSKLKLLKGIVGQVRELEGTVKECQETTDSLQLVQPSFCSFLKGIFPFSSFLWIKYPGRSKFAFLIRKKAGYGLRHGKRVGLSLLLHDSRTATCLITRRKVKFQFLASGINSRSTGSH